MFKLTIILIKFSFQIYKKNNEEDKDKKGF